MKKFMAFFLFFFCQIHGTIPYKVVICGVCRNVALKLPKTIQIFEKIGNLFEDYRVIAYENNSFDITPQILKKWAFLNNKIFVKSETVSNSELQQTIINSNQKRTCRPEAIARARNIVLQIALSPEYQDFNYIIWIDMDFTIEPAYEGFKETFESTQSWDAVFANGINAKNKYYDTYAFRDNIYPLGPELLGARYWWANPPDHVNLNKCRNWHPVISAFGGCGIYKKESLNGCQYSGLVTDDLASLYRKIIATNPSNFIVKKYLDYVKTFKPIINLTEAPSPALPIIKNFNAGIVTNSLFNDIIWSAQTPAYMMDPKSFRYPSVCEHVTLHASMIKNGHNKLFINPRLVFNYGNIGVGF